MACKLETQDYSRGIWTYKHVYLLMSMINHPQNEQYELIDHGHWAWLSIQYMLVTTDASVVILSFKLASKPLGNIGSLQTRMQKPRVI
jgi:hypothetical protein